MKFLRLLTGVALIIAILAFLPVNTSSTQTIAYQEDFEDGQAQGWELEPGWQVILDGNNHVLAGQGHVWARLDQSFNDDLRLSLRVKLLQGRIHLVVRLTDASRYFIGFDTNGSDLNKQYFPSEFQHNLATHSTPHSFSRWYQVEIVLRESTIEFLVDGAQQWSYTDPQPLAGGSFAFETQADSQAYVDDIRVETGTGTAAIATPPAPAAATATHPTPFSLTWMRTGGPLGGLGYDIRMRPDNPDIMYVTDANAGVFMSTDGGQSWIPKNSGIDLRSGTSGDLIPVFSLTIDPNNYNIIWIGMQSVGGVYRSIDGGQTWEKRVTGITERNCLTVRGITVEPGNSQTVYIAGEICSAEWNHSQLMGRMFDRTKGFVYKSTDAGLHWNLVWYGDNLARYIWIDPRNHNVVYVSTGIFDREAANTDVQTNLPGGVGILKSTDGGKTWDILDAEEGLTGLYVGSLFMHPRNPDILLAGAGHDYWSLAYDQNNREISPSGVFLSEDGGASWKLTLPHTQIYSVEYCLSDPNIAYAAGPFAVYRSQDSGHTWKNMTGDVHYWGPTGIVAGFPIDMQCDPRNPDRLFVNNYGGGNLLSEDGGITWNNASQGYSGAIVNGGLALDLTNPAHLFVAARSGLFSSPDGGLTWSGLAYKPARAAEAMDVAISPSNPTIILSAPWDTSHIIRSINGGLAWTLVKPNPDHTQVLAIQFSTVDPQTVYAAFGSGNCKYGTTNCTEDGAGIYISHDAGQSWQEANDATSQTLDVMALAIHPADPGTAYAGAMNGVFKTTNSGISWQKLNLTRQVWSLAIDPTNPEHIFAGTNAGIYISIDGGASWNASSAGLPPESKIRAIVINATDPQIIWAGDWFSGVYYSADGGSRWTPHNNGLTNRAITDLGLTVDGETLYASTQGGGVFRLSTHDQAYFDSLAPTSTPLPSTSTARPKSEPIPSTSTATPKLELLPSTSTATPKSEPTPGTSGGLPCGSALILPLVVLGIAWLARRR